MFQPEVRRNRTEAIYDTMLHTPQLGQEKNQYCTQQVTSGGDRQVC